MSPHDLIRKFISTTPSILQTNFLVAKFKNELAEYMGNLAAFAYLDLTKDVLSQFVPVKNVGEKHRIEDQIHEAQQTVMQFLKDKIEGTTISDCDSLVILVPLGRDANDCV